MFANDFKWSCWLIGRSPEEGNGLLLQNSCLENPKDRGAWQATVHSVTKSWIRLKWFSMHSDEFKNTESQIVRIDCKRKIKMTICQQNTVFLGVNCKAPTEILLLFFIWGACRGECESRVLNDRYHCLFIHLCFQDWNFQSRFLGPDLIPRWVHDASHQEPTCWGSHHRT